MSSLTTRASGSPGDPGAQPLPVEGERFRLKRGDTQIAVFRTTPNASGRWSSKP